MVLVLLKWLKETCSYKKKKKNIKAWTLHSTQEVGRKKKLARCLKKLKLYFNPQKKTTTTIGYFLSMEHHLLVAEKPWFWIFRGRKVRYFLNQNVDGNMILIDYWNVLVLNCSGMENTIFFEGKSWWKDDIYWLLKSPCFELFRDGKCSLFWGKNLMERWYLLITEKFLFWDTEKFLF